MGITYSKEQIYCEIVQPDTLPHIIDNLRDYSVLLVILSLLGYYYYLLENQSKFLERHYYYSIVNTTTRHTDHVDKPVPGVPPGD